MHRTFIQLPVVNGGIKSLLILANDLRGGGGVTHTRAGVRPLRHACRQNLATGYGLRATTATP